MAHAHAQEISFKDTVAVYNAQRIRTNKTGMKVLGAMGIASMVSGGVGYVTARQDEWKYFHGMNVLWGAVNTGIAFMGMSGVRKEMAAKYNYLQAYNRYLSNKKLYLINAGLDVLYIAGGVALNEYGRTAGNDKAIYQGFGKSIAIQGIALLLFDNIMFASHHRHNSKWHILMYDLRFTGNGIGFIHNF
ncbi:MAG: hypothetical protein K0Q79_2035 [Flavipsychrobacter sp.]|jgi:hypothetical protein|nr:hypothetical protein [Flavipsychrobacter sp.]